MATPAAHPDHDQDQDHERQRNALEHQRLRAWQDDLYDRECSLQAAQEAYATRLSQLHSDQAEHTRDQASARAWELRLQNEAERLVQQKHALRRSRARDTCSNATSQHGTRTTFPSSRITTTTTRPSRRHTFPPSPSSLSSPPPPPPPPPTQTYTMQQVYEMLQHCEQRVGQATISQVAELVRGSDRRMEDIYHDYCDQLEDARHHHHHHHCCGCSSSLSAKATGTLLSDELFSPISADSLDDNDKEPRAVLRLS